MMIISVPLNIICQTLAGIKSVKHWLILNTRTFFIETVQTQRFVTFVIMAPSFPLVANTGYRRARA